MDLATKQEPIDMMTVTEQLKKRGELEEIGGPLYISKLTEKVASSAHIEFHARIIAQKYLARELIKFTALIQDKAFDETIDVDDLMQEAEGQLFEISQNNLKKDFTQINPVIKEAFKQIKEALENKEGFSGLRSGFTGIDKITSGWQKSDLIIIAARPAMQLVVAVFLFGVHVACRFPGDVNQSVFDGEHLFGRRTVVLKDEAPVGEVLPVEQLRCLLRICHAAGACESCGEYDRCDKFRFHLHKNYIIL